MGENFRTPRRTRTKNFLQTKHKKKNTMASMTVANKMTAARGLSLKQRTSAPRPARFVSVRAAPEPPQAPEPERVRAAEAATPPPPPPPAKKDLSFGDAMAFSGPAPETINGRLAMLGFIAALGAEAASGETVFQQIGDAEPSILFAFIMFAAASLIPTLKGVKKEKFAFFSPEAEMLNGRAAMIGFALLLAIEAKSGSAFF